jgi:uncharacterized protein YndB with AHSA1/START domain
MHAQIVVHTSPDRLFAWLADPAHARHWFAQLRHEADVMPDPGMTVNYELRTVSWTTTPAGEMQVSGEGETADLSLTFAERDDPPEIPTEDQSPDDAPTNAGNALRSIKSHVEAAEGGDPDMHTPGVVSMEEVEEANREIEADPALKAAVGPGSTPPPR